MTAAERAPSEGQVVVDHTRLTKQERRANYRAIARVFVNEINARTVCAHCGEQPVEWHNPEHVQLNRENFRIGAMVAQGRTIDDIRSEMERCTPLCRGCHLRADGRIKTNLRPEPPHDPKPCTECAELWKPLRRGLCENCYRRMRRRA
jgi:hypothetical protein